MMKFKRLDSIVLTVKGVDKTIEFNTKKSIREFFMNHLNSSE